MPENPFNFSSPVGGSDFCSREKIVDDILHILLKKRGDIWLLGDRKAGKTSLLQHIDLSYEENDERIELPGFDEEFEVSFIYFDCGDCEDKNDFYWNLSQCLKERFDFAIDPENDPYLFFIQCLKKVHEEKFCIVFLLDQSDLFLREYIFKDPSEAGHFLDRFNAAKEGVQEFPNRPKVFSCVFASSSSLGKLTRNVPVFGSGFHVTPIRIHWFNEDHVSNLNKKFLESLAKIDS
ncbi:MAG: ATP-binding protein [bacterium]|nr:ATP-binding protein [bacterium]